MGSAFFLAVKNSARLALDLLLNGWIRLRSRMQPAA